MSQPETALPSARPGKTLPGATMALALLLAINLFNFLDRQILAAVEPEIRAEILPEHSFAKFWSGTLWFAFLITYMLIAPLFGWLADRSSRWGLIGVGILVWTLASGASGIDWLGWLGVQLSVAFWLLFLARCVVGVGEGAYGPIAPAMLADLFPVARRGQVMAAFYLAIPVGGALGYTLGGVVVNVLHWSWHWAFYLVVPPGLLLCLLCFLMKEPPRGETESIVQPFNRRPSLREYLDLFRIPSYVLNMVGMTCMTFAIGGLAFWIPAYLKLREVADVNLLGVNIEARSFFGLIVAVSGLLATISGGLAGDLLRSKLSGSYFVVSGVSMIAGFPLVLAALWTPFPLAWLFFFLAVFSLFFNTAPTNAINANVTHPAVRASAFALNILIIHTFGDAVSPAIIGLVAVPFSLVEGFVLVSLMMLVGGLFWLWGAIHLQRDTDSAPTRIRGE